ncbi:hypothetical protein [Micromonospora sp. PLK6-60]|nr:hypothetical protein [Micromonospora sp. PLK6-60]
MENINTVLTATDDELLTAAEVTSADFSDATVAPSIVLGEPCDV